MSADTVKKLRIFAASPSDVASERAKLESVVDSLKPMAAYLSLNLEVVDWRKVVPDAGRPQQVIFDQLKPTSWDIFIGILWHRFGTPPGGKDPQTQKDYLSGTEEEFRTAYRLWKEYKKPRIVMYRCSRAIPQESDFAQAQRVKDFFKEIQDPLSEFRVLTQSFDTTESFERLLLDHLQKLLIEYGEQSKTPITPEVVQILTPTIPNNLPRRQAFFGRAKEMETVMRALSPADRTWGVLVDGIGGIGKTAIAIEAAYLAHEAGSFDAFVFVTAKQNILEPSGIYELNPSVITLEEFMNETARILGQPSITKLTSNEKRRAIIDILRSMHTLLIYDNLETLSKKEQEEIADFLRGLPQRCKAIITSRRRGGEGGLWLRLEKLDWDAARGIIENEMARDSVLATKLRQAQLQWQKLYDETQGSPLALVHTLGLMRVRAALTFDSAIEMLRGNRDSNLQKFIFQEARKELTENDKVALGALSFFEPSAIFEAWMQVAGLTRSALETTIDRLSSLSLVDVLPGEESFGLHPITRVYVHENLLTDEQLVREIEDSFINYWYRYVTENGYEEYDSHYLLEVEWSNIKVTGDLLLSKIGFRKNKIKDESAAIKLFGMSMALASFMLLGGRWDERQKMNSAAYYIATALNNQDNAGWGAYHVAWVDGIYGRNLPNKAKLWVKRCSQTWKKSEDMDLVGESIRLRGLAALQNRRFKISERLLKNALSIKTKAKNQYGSMIVINDLGLLAFEQGKLALAKQYYKKALLLAEGIKSKEGQAFANANIADVLLKQKNFTEASKIFRHALPLAQKVGRIDLIARVKYGMAFIWENKGQLQKAIPLAKEGLELFQRLQHPNLSQSRELVQRLEKKAEVRRTKNKI